jgi:hypothetical protein
MPQKIADCLVSIWNDILKIIPKGNRVDKEREVERTNNRKQGGGTRS